MSSLVPSFQPSSLERLGERLYLSGSLVEISELFVSSNTMLAGTFFILAASLERLSMTLSKWLQSVFPNVLSCSEACCGTLECLISVRFPIAFGCWLGITFLG